MPHITGIPGVRKIINFLKHDGNVHIWKIDGTEVMLRYSKKSCNESMVLKIIKQLKMVLVSNSYKCDDYIFNEYLSFFGFKAFMRLGMVWPEDFIRCFSYYSDLYASEWAQKEQKHFQSL